MYSIDKPVVYGYTNGSGCFWTAIFILQELNNACFNQY